MLASEQHQCFIYTSMDSNWFVDLTRPYPCSPHTPQMDRQGVGWGNTNKNRKKMNLVLVLEVAHRDWTRRQILKPKTQEVKHRPQNRQRTTWHHISLYTSIPPCTDFNRCWDRSTWQQSTHAAPGSSPQYGKSAFSTSVGGLKGKRLCNNCTKEKNITEKIYIYCMLYLSFPLLVLACISFSVYTGGLPHRAGD